MIKGEGQISDIFKSYLYSDLEAVDRDELEDRLFADSAFAEQLEDFENDLVDSYIREEMSGHERDAFETRYLVSASHRQKVTVAKVLHDKKLVGTRQQPGVVEGSEPGFWTAIVHAWQNRNFALASGLAAAILVGILGTWWYVQVGDDRVARTDNSNADISTNETPNTNDNSNSVTARNENNNVDSRSPEPSRSPSVSRPAPVKQTRVFAFTLLPMTRSSDRPVIEVPAAAETVMLTLVHDDQREFRSFKVELKATGGGVVWNRDIRVSRRQNSSSVVVGIPAAVLRSGNYEIGLTGVTQDAVTEDLKFYQFSVKN